MVTRLGTILGTQLGTDLGSFGDGPPVFDASKLYALSGFSGADYYATQSPGGEAGDAAGFGALVLIRLPAQSGVARYLFNRSNAGNAGWLAWIDSTNVVKFFCASGAGAGISSPGFQLTASDAGRVIALAVQHDGTKARLFVSRAQAADGTAITGYTALAFRTTMSGTPASPTTNPAVGVQELAWLTFQGTPSQAQLFALLDAIRTLGDAPTKAAAEALMPGTTVTHRWSLREVLAALNVPVIDSQAAPATIPDSVTAASADAMSKTGSPVVRVLDPGLYPRTSYGALGAGGTNYFASAQNAGLVGSASGFSVAIIADLFALAATTTGYLYCQNAGDARGFVVYMISAVTLRFLVYDGSGAAVVADVALTAADMGRKALIVCQHEGSNIRTYLRGGTQVATAAITGYSVQTTNAYVGIGGYPVNNFSLTGGAVYDVATASAGLTTGEITQLFTDFDNTGLIVPNAKHVHRWNFTQDVVSNGGAINGVPATSTDRIGSTGLTRTGTGLQVAQRTERLWSYETSPILYGADGMTLADFFETATQLGDSNTQGFWATVFYLLASQSVTSKPRDLFGSINAASTAGFAIRSNTTNSNLNMLIIDNAAAARTTPLSVLAATDVGKLHAYTGVWDQPGLRVRGYAKRAEAGSGTTVTGYTPNAANGLRIGRNYQASDRAADGVVIYGVAAGLGVPTLAQIQAQFDAIMATERVAGIPGMTSLRVDIDADARANANTIPATLTDRQSGTFGFAKNGSPTTTPQYARAFGW